jgi:membrane associated rhomboid family serine protease/uncharacterized Tic20 family protein/ssDNA-binding Zn-finger/Zn-ribbon topoisomerase 1
MFLHAGGAHLWGNMIFLWVVGSAVERRVGRARFFTLYLITGLIGGFVFILVEYLFHARAGHALGASGAIAGIMGIFAVRCYFKSMIFPLPILGIFSLILPISLKIRLNSLVIMALFFLSDLSGGIDQLSGQSASMVGHWVHLGGMISGMLIAGYLKLGEDAVEERHLEIGIKASEAGIGFEGGERSLQIALDRNPDNADALLGMARLKSRFNSSPEGRELYEKAIGLLVKERPAEVLEVFREYFVKYRTAPPDPRLVSTIAGMLQKAGDIELQIHCLERLVEMPGFTGQDREQSLFQLGTLLEFTSRFEAARSCFARFVAEFPGSILVEKAKEKAGDEVYESVRTKPEAERLPEPERASALKSCPSCGAEMVPRTATSGAGKGKSFMVCSAYPVCRTYLLVESSEAVASQPAAVRATYTVAFDGTVALSSDPEETREKLARLFRCSRDRIDKLFCGKKIALKKGMDHAAALKMKQAIDSTGAIATVEVEETLATSLYTREPVQPAPLPSSVETSAPPPSKPDFECPKCGFRQEKGESCIRCGVFFAKLAGIAERQFHSFHHHLPGGAENRGISETVERRWAMCCHLMALTGFLIPFGNFLGPLAIWLWKRKESEFIDYHGKTALNYQLTLVLLGIGSILVLILNGPKPFFIFLAVLSLYNLFVIGFAAIKSNRGDYVEIPFCAGFIK